MSTYESLEPSLVWKTFADINRIPRMSGQETAVMAMLEKRAQSRGFKTKKDAFGNMLVGVPASRGRENAPAVLLQGHVDMVCEKDASTPHDFAKDPIIPTVDGEWVRARAATTLGADNAIGVSLALAAAEDPAVAHGPLEILLTVDEERGLRGAAEVPAGFFSARLGLNLDSEDDTALTVGCAGMQETLLTLKSPRASLPDGWKTLEVFIGGLSGGHSGLDIHKNLGNAIRTLARALLASGLPVRVASLDGGSKRNAIPREARAVVGVPTGKEGRLESAAKSVVERIRREEVAPDAAGPILRVASASPSAAWSEDVSTRLLEMLTALPHGVVAIAPEGIRSSTNIAVAATEGDAVRVCCTSRSSVNSDLEQMARQHRAIGALAAASVEQGMPTPGWAPDAKSRVLAVVKERYASIFGREPAVHSVHAGLECGVLRVRTPDLDMISFGPDIVGAHSPGEKVKIASVQRIWNLLVAVLDRLSA
jgi:dipeptidase D